MKSKYDFPTRDDLINARKNMMRYRSYWLKQTFGKDEKGLMKIFEIESDLLNLRILKFDLTQEQDEERMDFNDYRKETFTDFEEDFNFNYETKLTEEQLRILRELWDEVINSPVKLTEFKNSLKERYDFYIKKELDVILVFPKSILERECIDKNQLIISYIAKIKTFCNKFHMGSE